jgi:Flp pilus assembly protein TadG
MNNASRRTGRYRTRGAAMIEITLTMIALFGILFLLMDLSWVVFAKVSIQHAVREGCRYAVTSQTSGSLGHVDSIRQVVQRNAAGFLSTTAEYEKIHVTFFRADTQQQLTGAGSNAGGNLVVVSVDDYTIRPMVPLVRPGTPLSFSVRAGDKLESSPRGIVPNL